MPANSYQVTLTWPSYPHQGTITSLVVRRDSTIIATLPASATSFIDDGTTVAGAVDPLTTYDYTVTVNFNQGCPARAAEDIVDVGCYAGDATSVAVVDNTDGTAGVTWALPTTGLPFYGYTVAWGTAPGGPYTSGSDVIANPAATSATIATGAGTWYVIVQGMDSIECASPGDNEQSVTVTGFAFSVSWTPPSADLPALIGKFAYNNASNLAGVTALTFSETTNREGYDLETCPNLVTVNCPNLTGITDAATMTIKNCVALTTITWPVFVPANGQAFVFSGNALTQAVVDAFLALAVANAGYVSGSINLAGGTNATPNAGGLVNKATLIGRGVTVTTN